MTEVTAPMTGSVFLVHVEVGDDVGAHSELITLESMKMEIPIPAPVAGRVSEVRVQPGDVVQEGDVVAVIA
jgi:acetyl-CoA carboxylase biotin carboxyl carrier protein